MTTRKRTYVEVVKELFPEATDSEVEFILWEKTGYPTFWRTKYPLRELRAQLKAFKREVETARSSSK